MSYVIGEFIHSKKNHPAKDFYKKMGLEKKYQDNKEFWNFDLGKKALEKFDEEYEIYNWDKITKSSIFVFRV